MKLKTIVGATVVLALACCAQAQNEEGGRCSNETLKGAYGVQLSGVRPTPFVPTGKPGFVGQLEQVIGYDIIVFDGKGNFTQVDNLKGTISGFVPNRPGSGTYVVNADCSVVSTIQPAPGVTIVTRAIIVDGGKEYRGFTTIPEEINMTFIGRQIK